MWTGKKPMLIWSVYTLWLWLELLMPTVHSQLGMAKSFIQVILSSGSDKRSYRAAPKCSCVDTNTMMQTRESPQFVNTFAYHSMSFVLIFGLFSNGCPLFGRCALPQMVLSACSPYFQALFVNHPEKHPIVILKDITYADMKSLLDFMYRGEVSVDQDRLTAFLRVAESLRIKGLTEVNDDKPEKSEPATQTAPQAQSPTQPPQLHRIQQPFTQQQKSQGMLLTNPLLGSALTQPKRKRGRPRKLSGSSNGNDFDGYESGDNVIQVSAAWRQLLGRAGLRRSESWQHSPIFAI